jgi:histidinol-phosphate phosphatase family protein
VSFEVVVPSAGRPSLTVLLTALDGVRDKVVVVDDRGGSGEPLEVPAGVRVVRGPARGPAAARNAGWRACSAHWVAFLDDDVEPEPGWHARLATELAAAARDVGGVQGRIVVPLPADRPPTDWERNTQGLERARWATADLVYRRAALEQVGGFDERFPRAYREDADLGLRVTAAGWRIVLGERTVRHPARPAPASVSLSKQAGNADDVLMRRLHGGGWRERAGVPRGRRPRHVAVTAAVAAALAARRPRIAAAAWVAGTAELAWARIAPGPRTPHEVATMLWTSALIPFAATAWWLWGHATLRRRLAGAAPPTARASRRAHATAPTAPASRHPHATAPTARASRRPRSTPSRGLPGAVLFDRDGTLVVDVPYNGDPARVEPVPGAAAALARLRGAGVPTGVVSNQSGIARGLVTEAQVRAVNARVEELLGPLGAWTWCPHGPADGCGCRKPEPGLILRAAGRLGVDPARCVVIGDVGADVQAARAAGARAILVPTPVTRPEEVAAAEEVAPDLAAAIDRVLAVSA